jgi:hypothetical protein
MGFVMIGSEFPYDAEELDDAEVRVHLDALAWNRLRELDGRIPKRDIARLSFHPDAEAVFGRLAARGGWWDDDGDAYQLMHHPEWQRSHEQHQNERAKGRVRDKRRRLHNKGDHSLCDPNRCEALLSEGTHGVSHGVSPP